MKGSKNRIKNEELWQKLREEVIFVITDNDIKSKDELIVYFKDHHTDYELDFDDLEFIINNSAYINKLLNN